MIVCTGKPTGVLRTNKQYENFILELDWRHMHAGGNAGLFVWSDPITAPGVPFTRSVEVQILDGRNSDVATSHGDIFAIHGAEFVPDRPHPQGWMRCLPSERRCRPAGEWNHYRVECRDGDIKLAVNGKVVSGGHETRPCKGYICLESEGSEVHFRNIRICELPAGQARPESTAAVAEGYRSLYTGLDLRGWQAPPRSGAWNAADWTLEWTGGEDGAEQTLRTESQFSDCSLIVDWRWSNKDEEATAAVTDGPSLRLRDVAISLAPMDLGKVSFAGKDYLPSIKSEAPAESWNRAVITSRGRAFSVSINGQLAVDIQLPGDPSDGSVSLRPGAAPLQFANIYVSEFARE
jgi:hypothetical protein